MQTTNKSIIGKPQKTLLVWIFVPFIFVSFLNGFLLSVVRASVGQIQEAIQVSTSYLEITPYSGSHTGLVTFWFDDAWKSEYSEAFSQMTEAGYKGALAVPTELVGYPAYMDWDQVIEVQESGWEINAHSRIHDCNIKDQSYEELEEQVVGSKQDLAERNLFNEIYVIPCGVHDGRLLEIISRHYPAARGVSDGVNEIPVLNPHLLKANSLENTTTLKDVAGWIKEAEDANGWLNLMFHAVTNDPGPEVDEYTVSPEFLAAVITMVKDSELNVALPSEILAITDTQWQEE